MLSFGHADDQAIQFIGYLDLAGKPAVVADVFGEIKHGRFHFRAIAGFLQRAIFQIDVA